MVRTIIRLAITLAVALSVPTVVQAASPHQVDPAGLLPPLNPDFGPWICTDTGGGPVCRGEAHDAWSGEDTGLRCGGATVYATGRWDSQASRWHTSTGLAEHTFFKNQAIETWTLSPAGTGRSVTVRGSWNQHYVYPIPGDRPTRVMTITGADWQVTAKGVGIVFHDAGFVRYLPGSEGDIDFTRGPTDSDHGELDLVIAEVCSALAA